MIPADLGYVASGPGLALLFFLPFAAVVVGFGLVAWALNEYTKPPDQRRSWPWDPPR